MPRKREIKPSEAGIWLGIMLDAAFDPTSKTLNLARSAEVLNEHARQHGMQDALKLTVRDGQSQLLSLASDFVNYPEDYSDQRKAEMLLVWANQWLQPQDWQRLQERLKKRRKNLLL